MPSLFSKKSIGYCQVGDCPYKHNVGNFLDHYLDCHNEGIVKAWNGQPVSLDFYVALWDVDEIRSIGALAYMGTPGQPPRPFCMRNEISTPGYQFAKKSMGILVLGELNCRDPNTGTLPLLRDEYTMCVYIATSPPVKPIKLTLNACRRGGSIVKLDPVLIGNETQVRNEATILGTEFYVLCYRQFHIPNIELSEQVTLELTVVDP